ncbi:MAG TPA: M48 family metalloprotease [Terriglobales bacterium]|nr:M48 family metalloprotease [Terriglobales bacterium]
MSARRPFFAILLFTLFAFATPSVAQFGKVIPGGKKNQPDNKPAAVGAAPDYTDKDKQEMDKIAQQQETKDRIESAWSELRHRDLDFAYRVNLSNRLTEGALQVADFRNDFGQLYDNPIVARYVNSLGQRLVPKDSPNVFAFRVLLDPEPRAETISTGTIYVSTGLIAMLDNEAQLSYVLAHEVAHVERNHFYNKLRNSIIEEIYWQQKEESAEKKRALLSLGMGVAGGLIGRGAGGSARDIFTGAGLGTLTGYIAGSYLFRNKFIPTNWSVVYEDEADENALKYMLEQNYDAREVPRLYATLDRVVKADPRLGLGFIGNPARVKERTSKIQAMLGDKYKADLEKRLKDAGLTGSSGEYNLVMSALKRDNGIVALDYDLFAEARDNLEEAVSQRSNDPLAHYYLGKVLALTGRTQEDKQQAVKYFQAAIKLDAGRLAFADPHLDYALYLINQPNPPQGEILKELKTFVLLYQRDHGGALPGNMHILYDYFLLAGDTSWYVPPASVVSTKWVDPVNTTGSSPKTLPQMIGVATDSPAQQGPSSTSSPARPAPAVKKASAATK